MKWIGLTGGIGSGKSTVAKMLRELGEPVIDADDLAHEVMACGGTAYSDIVKLFGKGILNSAHEIDRKKLGNMVFSDKNLLKNLESIVHPRVRELSQKRRRELESRGFARAFYDVPLLFEKNLQNQFDTSVLVYCSESLQKQRIRERNGLNDEEIDRRLSAQIPIDEKRQRADFVIDNSGSLADLKSEVRKILSQL